MNFTKFDLLILFTMALAVVVMSFMFPALGLTDENAVNQSDIPEYSQDAGAFDIGPDLPDAPNTQDSGTLNYDEEQGNSIEGVTLDWIEYPKDEGLSIEVQNTSEFGFDILIINYSYDSSGNPTTDLTRFDITEEGEEFLMQEYNYVIEFRVTELSNLNQPNMTAAVEYDIQSSPADSQGVSSIPFIGGIADAVGKWLGYLAVIITWAVGTIIEIALAVIVALYELVVYLFGMATWLISTYQAIVTGAPGWASVIVTLPAILLFAELAKLTAIAISLLPTT